MKSKGKEVIIIEKNEGYVFRFPFDQLDGMTNIHKAKIKKDEGTTFIYFYDKEITEELFRNPQNMKIVVAERRFKNIESSSPIYYKLLEKHKPLRKQIAINLRNELKEKLKIENEDLYERMRIELGCSKGYAKAVLLGIDPLRLEYVLILTEKYNLSLEAIFFGKQEDLKIPILQKIQDLIRNEKEPEVQDTLKTLFNEIFTRIDNAKTKKDKENICDDLLDALQRDGGYNM
jgi:hypothetical protein